MVLEEHLTYAAVAAKLEIRKVERIEAWAGMYRRGGKPPLINRLEGRSNRKRTSGSWNTCGWKTHF